MVAVEGRADAGPLALLPALLVAGGALLAGLATLYAPPPQGEMAVVFAPWIGEVEVHAAILAAGGGFAGGTRLGNVAVAWAGDVGFADRIRERGALMVFAASALCGPQETTRSI